MGCTFLPPYRGNDCAPNDPGTRRPAGRQLLASASVPATAADALGYFAPAGLEGVRLGEDFGCAA
jgi:hypothetical protein